MYGVVVPNSAQNCWPVWPKPLSRATGTSTAGVRTPPSTLPVTGSSAYGLPVVSSRGATGGRVPSVIQRFRCDIAARSTKVAGPVLIGELHVKVGLGWFVGCCMKSNHSSTDSRSPTSVRPVESPYWSKCDVPATSQRR